ncbi:TetR/AcrR family transcriptional regulator [Dactylosporangium darangshiense]
MATQRRRGPELEAALLDAVWDELAETGYARLTMEGVAARANTGKQVLYRRWPSRAHLVLAAVRHRWSSIVDDLPDTGSLREDVLSLMRRMADRFERMSPDLVHGLLAEAGQAAPEIRERMGGAMDTLLTRAAERGEADPSRITPRVATVAIDLLRHELFIVGARPTDETMATIVDEVFLPLVRKT